MSLWVLIVFWFCYFVQTSQKMRSFLTGLFFLAGMFFAAGCDLNAPDRPAKPVAYTRHALCRMKCRNINESEVSEILRKGKVNKRKSDANAKPCPTEAIEGLSADGQKIRVVVGRCQDSDKIITVIDLENEYVCSCN
jgi:hypothetical protein